MLKLGEVQDLIIVRKVTFGFYLAESRTSYEEVLLPGGQISDETPEGTRVKVFLYKDSQDRLIATTRMPKLTLGGIATLRVKETGKIGAFLDWGMPKDLLLPFREQTVRVEKGKQYPVALYIDKSDRLCATMHLHDYLRNDSTYQKDDRVEGHIYDSNPKYGYFVAVDDLYAGMIPVREETTELAVGETVHCRVSSVREDGRLNLSRREKSYLQMGPDAEAIMKLLKKQGGCLMLSDHSSPEEIKKALSMSKAAFKRSIGHLFKLGKIQIKEDRILLTERDEA